jgi:ABC-type antimicrobial peptide transport system permease subunit
MLKSYLITAIRNIRRQPWFSIINISGLALGMACTVLILLWVHSELSFDNFHKNRNVIFRLIAQYKENKWENCPWALKSLLTKNYPEVESATWFRARQMSFVSGEKQSTGNIGMVSPEYLDVFTFRFISGNSKSAFVETDAVVITEKVSNELFGGTNAIGKSIKFEDGQELFVSGIIEDVPGNSHMQFDLLVRPDLFYGVDRLSTWIVDCSTYIMLDDNADSEVFEEKISNIVNENDGGEWDGKMTISLQPLRKIHTHALNGTDPIVFVRIFSLIAFIVLLISCVNFINLSTSQSVARSKEIAFRKTAGSNKKDIFIQYLSETMVLATISMILALIIIYILLPEFNDLTGKNLSLFSHGSIMIFSELLIITLITGILAGTYPSIYFTSFQPVQLFKGLVGNKGRGNNVRRTLIIFQFSSAIVLLLFIFIIIKQINYINNTDIGLDRNNVITVSLDRAMRDKYETIKENLLKNSSVMNVTSSSNIPLNTSTGSTVYWESINPEEASLMNFVCVDYDYFETLGMKIIEGRSFSRDFPYDMNSYIINETALQLTGFNEPIGKGIALSNHQLEPIIGVVKDFHGTSLRNNINPTIFFMFKYAGKRNMFVKVSEIGLSSTLDYIIATINEITPGSFINYTFLDDQFNDMYQKETVIRSLVKYFAILALFIASMGLLGLASFLALQKTKEFAIRRVFGAKPFCILISFFKEFALLIIVSCIIAWPISFIVIKNWLATYSYKVKIDFFAFLITGFIVLLIAFLVTAYHSYKTSRCNLVYSLKYE